MADLGRILIADNDETFLRSTADWLRAKGYECDCVPDAAKAAEKLTSNDYVLLIADTEIPGNSELQLIRDMPSIAEGVPVILVTNRPSLRSAIRAVELPVQAYIVKPLDFEKELLTRVRIAVKQFQLYRSVHSIKQRLQGWYDGLVSIEELLALPQVKSDSQKTLSVSLDAFLELTYQNILGAMSDLKHLTRAFGGNIVRNEPCHLLSCPRLSLLADGLAETIEVLEKSKSAFKSKNLGQIRKKLESLLTAE